MKFAIGETVLLGETRYHIRERLASGAVSDVYRATLADAPACEVVIKRVRDDASLDPLKVEGVRREAEVLSILNQAEGIQWPRSADVKARLQRARETASQRRVVALLDSGELGPDQPFLVQEKAPPPFERFAVENPADEQRMLTIAHAAVGVIALAHRHDLALKDFEPHTKWDRIRLRWLDGQEGFELKIIDWNITGGREDMVQDLFFFGLHLYRFLLGHHVALDVDGQPPVNLGLGVPGWEELTEGSRQILQRLLHRAPRRRYQQATELEADLAWWVDTLRQAEAADGLDRLQDRVWQARPQGQHGRMLAAADLGLRRRPPPPSEVRQAFELWARQAREELEKEDWQPIAHARATLLTGAYEKAVGEFAQQLRALSPDREAARLARLFQRLAQAGDLLKQANQGVDVRSNPEWEALTRATNALVRRQWDEAQTALLEATHLQPEATAWRPVNELRDLARAGLLLQEAASLSTQAEPRRADAGRADWIQVENAQIDLLERAVAKLRKAQQLAPLEPDFQDRLQAEQARLGRRRSLLVRYQDADQFIDQGNRSFQQGERAEDAGDLATAVENFHRATEAFQSALDEFQAILEADPAQYRARLLQDSLSQDRLQPSRQAAEARWHAVAQRVETVRQAQEALARGQELLRQGAYSEALSHIRRADDLTPGEQQIQDNLAQAEAGSRLERRAHGALETARQHIQMGNLTEAQDSTRQAITWHGQSLASLPGGESLPFEASRRPFILRSDLRDEATDIQEEARFRAEVHRRVKAAWKEGQYNAILDELTQLNGRYVLTKEEEEWKERAKGQLESIQQTQQLLDQEPTFDELRQVLSTVPPGDPNPRARALREKAGTWWQKRVSERWDVTTRDRLREGVERCVDLPVVEKLRQMQEWAEVGQRIEEALIPWQALPPSQARSRLPALDADLGRLIGEADEWPALQTAARRAQEQLLSAVRERALPILGRARALAEQRAFKEAAQTAHDAWEGIPSRLRALLPPDAGEEGFVRLLKDLETRQRTEAGLESLVEDVVGGRKTFAQAVTEAQQLPWPSDLPTDELENIREALQHGARGEEFLQQVPQVEPHAECISKGLQWQAQTEPIAGPLPDKWAPLRGALGNTWQQVKEQVRQQAEALLARLREEEDALLGDPQHPPETFLKLYWQARWLREILPKYEVTASDLLKRSLDIWGSLSRDLQERLTGLQDLAGLEVALQQAERLHRLLGGLYNRTVDLPSALGESAPLRGLPAPETARRMAQALETFHRLREKPVSDLDEAEASLKQVVGEIETLQLLSQDSGEEWSERHALPDLGKWIEKVALPFADRLRQAQSLLDAGSPVEVLALLGTERPKRQEELVRVEREWLLRPALGMLRQEYDDLRRAGQRKLESLALQSLGDLPQAPRRLQERLMEPAGTPALREAAREAIIGAANQASGFTEEDRKQRRKAEQRGQAQAVWKAVEQAALLEEGVAEWNDLALYAKEQSKALRAVPSWLPAASVIALFVALLAIGGVIRQSQHAMTAQRATASAMAEATETAIADERASAAAAAKATEMASAHKWATATAVQATERAMATQAIENERATATAGAQATATAVYGILGDCKRTDFAFAVGPPREPRPIHWLPYPGKVDDLKSQFVLTNTGECALVEGWFADEQSPLKPVATLPKVLGQGDTVALSYAWPPLEAGSHAVTLTLSVQDAQGRRYVMTHSPAVVAIDLVIMFDRDGDRVADGEDRCKDDHGPKELQGCPDGDGDGIADVDDCCPELEGIEGFDGCPDNDDDGFPESVGTCTDRWTVDQCPGQPGSKNGCPSGGEGGGNGEPGR